MRHVLCAFIGSVLLSSASFAAKPPPAASNPQVAYISGSGNSVKLMVADENGSGAHVLYSSSAGFRFDLAPRAQRQIAINGNDNSLRLLSYTESNGVLTASGPPVALTSAWGGTSIDFSPDGRRIAYMCCAGAGQKQLMVYDLDTQAATAWADVQFVWDVAFFRNGASIAYIEPAANNMYAIYEVNGAGAMPRQIFSTLGDFNLDSARTRCSGAQLPSEQHWPPHRPLARAQRNRDRGNIPRAKHDEQADQLLPYPELQRHEACLYELDHAVRRSGVLHSQPDNEPRRGVFKDVQHPAAVLANVLA